MSTRYQEFLDLPDVMHAFGSGISQETKFSLLIPLHIYFTLSSLQVSLCDYSLPLIRCYYSPLASSLWRSTFLDCVPRTIMPVKTYAAPIVDVTTTGATIFSWVVSYGPAIQDIMHVVDTLSSSPRDSSPVIGFWDKVS